MFAIMGATGTVGNATATALREKNVPVRAILRDPAKAARLREIGCDTAIADLQGADALAEALSGAEKVQVILPLSPQAQDPIADLRRSTDSLVAALDKTRPLVVLAISDYGAHVEADIGMPSVFRAFEDRLSGLSNRTLILRSAEHMQNWMRALPAALVSGHLASLQIPTDAPQPTISAADLGRIAADLLLDTASGKSLEIIHAEGPRRYSADDVAAAFSLLCGRRIQARAVPRPRWKEVMARALRESLADLLIRTNDAKNWGGLVDISPGTGAVRLGTTELVEALRPSVTPL